MLLVGIGLIAYGIIGYTIWLTAIGGVLSAVGLVTIVIAFSLFYFAYKQQANSKQKIKKKTGTKKMTVPALVRNNSSYVANNTNQMQLTNIANKQNRSKMNNQRGYNLNSSNDSSGFKKA